MGHLPYAVKHYFRYLVKKVLFDSLAWPVYSPARSTSHAGVGTLHGPFKAPHSTVPSGPHNAVTPSAED